MIKRKTKDISRRDFFKKALGALPVGMLSSGPFFLFPERARRHRKKLKILRWRHPLPEYDQWFEEVFTAEWERKYGTKVVIDRLPIEKIASRAAVEVTARKGHDLVMFPWPPARYEKFVINHKDVYQAVAGRQGNVVLLGHQSTYNPKTKKYFAFADSYVVAPFLYRSDYWAQIGYSFGPTNYDSLRAGARQLRESLGIPCGLGLAPEWDSNIWLHGLLWSFGASVQDASGNVTINSAQTIEALRYVAALYKESGVPDVFRWTPRSNDHALLDGKVSCTVDAIHVIRRAEREKKSEAAYIMPSPALRGPAAWLICPYITSCSVIWEFAQNKEDAHHFLVELVDHLQMAFHASGYCNFPCFPKSVPKLKVHLENDLAAQPHHKYATLEDALVWTRSIGQPGFVTPPLEEVFTTFVIPRMFAAVAKGRLSPEESAAAAEREIASIFEKWRNG